MVASFEENVKEWLYKNEIPKIIKDGKVKYSLDRDKAGIDFEISKALADEPSKLGGSGGGEPDSQLLFDTSKGQLPVIIELKGTKGRLTKYTNNGLVKLYKDDGEIDYQSSVSLFASNGAVYYSRAILKNTEKFKNIIAIGVNGYLMNEQPFFEVEVYLLNNDDYELPILLGKYENLSFLYPENLTETLSKIEMLLESPKERELRVMDEENRYEVVLKDLNQKLHSNDHISTSQRVDLVVASIMAGIGHNNVKPLKLSRLEGSTEDKETDGDLVLSKAENFLKSKGLPENKVKQIINQLTVTLLNSNNQFIDDPKKNESPIKQVYRVILEEIIPLLRKSKRNDFMGKLFNTMYAWVAVPDGDKNDVVLTPRYVADLMAKLAEIDRDSYVWDWALGSGGLLISAMNLMLDDANRYYSNNPQQLSNKINHIKEQQLLGVEKLPNVYVLAVLNMILMGDGSSNIIQDNSLQYDGTYAYSDKKFEATTFLVNPPYSAEGNGMIFLEAALKKMKGTGKRAVIIIQDSAGKGKAENINQRILKDNSLVASVKMPDDIFPNGVQTSIYVFDVGKSHKPEQQVKFVDFRRDGYTRTNRKKSNINLVDNDHAFERYADLISIINYGKRDSKYFIFGDNVIEDSIDPTSGRDWNWESHTNKVGSSDNLVLQKVLSNYLTWNIGQNLENATYTVSSQPLMTKKMTLSSLFHKIDTKKLSYKVREIKDKVSDSYVLPALTAGINNQGLSVKVPKENATILHNVITVSANGKNSGAMFYQPNDFTVLQDAYAIELHEQLLEKNNLKEANKYHYLYLLALMTETTKEYDWSNKATWNRIKDSIVIDVPITQSGNIDFNFMESETKKLLLERQAILQRIL